MLTYVVGVPGAGKTYYSLKTLIDHFDPKHPNHREIDYIYTNIAKLRKDQLVLDMDESHGNSEEYHPKTIYPFKYETFIKIIESLHFLKEEDEDIIIETAREKKIYGALFIIDEAHNFFHKQSEALTWFLTYHRHLAVELYLITQNKGLIYKSYRVVGEQFLECEPQSKRIKKNIIKINKYTSFTFNTKTKYEVQQTKIDKGVFKYYESGKDQKQKPIILKFAGYLVVSVVLMVFLLFQLLSKFSPEDQLTQEPKNIPSVESPAAPNRQVIPNIKDSVVVDVLCGNGECSYNGGRYTDDYFFNVLKQFQLKVLDTENMMVTYHRGVVMSKGNFQNVLRDEVHFKRYIVLLPSNLLHTFFDRFVKTVEESNPGASAGGGAPGMLSAASVSE